MAVTAPHRSRVMHRLPYLRNWELANVLLVPAMIDVIAYLGDDPLDHWIRRAIGTVPVSYLMFP